MKSDITRSTFNHKTHYSGVRMQQGRVQLDADWNEQIDIVNHRSETGTLDIIGACGAPENHAGFELIEENHKPKIKAGRFYVDGMLCTNEADVLFEAQPDLPGVSLPDAPGYYIAYLDVWQRSITAIEDPNLREVALGVADTATRMQTVWQVKLAGPNTLYGNHNDCEKNFENWARPLRTRRARMLAQVVPVESELGEAGATASNIGFRGVQNHLYRVEIHEPAIRGGGGTDSRLATFKWSRDNGSFLRAIKTIEGDIINLLDPGRDDLQRFQPGQWIEVSNDPQELGEAGAGVLVRIKSVTAGVALQIEPETATGALPASLPSDQAARERWKVRRWDQKAEAPVTTVSANEWLPLEDGLEVKFGAGDIYHPGDYWLIPTRAVTGGTIDWPIDENTKAPLPQSRFGIHHHYCPLAILNNSGGAWTVEHDCRRIFSSLTEQLNFFYVSGDGQETLPGRPLPRPLQVGVTNGSRPVANANINFKIDLGAGTLHLQSDASDDGKSELPLTTGHDGIAECYWKLDDINFTQQTIATLRDSANKVLHLPISFNANHSRASTVAYYEPPACANMPPTVLSLLADKLQHDWDYDNDGNPTVRDVLDIFLCLLDAESIPFKFDECDNGIFPNQKKSVAEALRALCSLAARHVGYETPACGTEAEPSVQSLFENASPEGWPPRDEHGRTTVQLILDALLCRLTAYLIPFKPDCANDLYPQNTKSIGEALKALCDLAAKHVGYETPTCGTEGSPSVQSLFENAASEDWPPQDARGRTTVQLILDALLCRLTADLIPFIPDCTTGLYPPDMARTVGAALKAICNIKAEHVAYGDTTLAERMAFALNHNVPTGTILIYAGSASPSGQWLLCDGAAISRILFANLFGVIGTTYGSGDGATTFNLPNLQGRVPIGSGPYFDPSVGLVHRNLAVQLGAAAHVLTVAEMPRHTHQAFAPNHDVSGASSQGWPAGNVHNSFRTSDRDQEQELLTDALRMAGTDQAHNNMQPSLVVNYIIKT